MQELGRGPPGGLRTPHYCRCSQGGLIIQVSHKSKPGERTLEVRPASLFTQLKAGIWGRRPTLSGGRDRAEAPVRPWGGLGHGYQRQPGGPHNPRGG